MASLIDKIFKTTPKQEEKATGKGNFLTKLFGDMANKAPQAQTQLQGYKPETNNNSSGGNNSTSNANSSWGGSNSTSVNKYESFFTKNAPMLGFASTVAHMGVEAVEHFVYVPEIVEVPIIERSHIDHEFQQFFPASDVVQAGFASAIDLSSIFQNFSGADLGHFSHNAEQALDQTTERVV